MCIRVYVHAARILKAVTPPSLFMVWLWAWKLSNCETLPGGSEMSLQYEFILFVQVTTAQSQ